MDTERPATYSYAALADRIEEVLGERPSRSALRAASAKDRGTGAALARPRATIGMPAPLHGTSRTAPAVFDVDEIEQWLANHPRLRWQRAVDEMAVSLARGADEEQVVAAAVTSGLPWRTITAQLNAHDGRGRTVAGIHKRYRHVAGHGQD